MKQPLTWQFSFPTAIYVVLQPQEASENAPIMELPTAVYNTLDMFQLVQFS